MRRTSPAPAAVVLVATAAVLTAAVLGVLTSDVAHAHTGGDGDVVLTLDPVPAGLEGVTVEVVNRLAPQLVLANPTDRVVEVLGVDGRPFLRIGPDGVEANLTVADWYTTNDPFGGVRLPDAVGGDDLWGAVAEEPSWGWFDHRLHPGVLQAPPAVVSLGEPADFDRWEVPVTVDGRPVALTGSFRYQPLRGTFVTSITDEPDLGVQLSVLPGLVPGLFLDNGSQDEVVVLGADGEPFLRFTRERVEANVRSPAWIASARSAEGMTPTTVVDARAEPEWVEVADTPRYGWIDPRLAYDDREPPSEVIAAAAPAEVAQWTLPVVAAGEDTAFAGVITWQPDPDLQPVGAGGSDLVRWAAVLAVAALAAAGVLHTRRRASRQP